MAPSLRIGVTGSREGMTARQAVAVAALLRELRPSEFHHGDCVGVDDQCASLVAAAGLLCRVVVHPPRETAHRAYNLSFHETRPPLPYFERNRRIVGETDALIVVPNYPEPIAPQTRGGTAYTYTYAGKLGRPRLVVRPDGRVERFAAAALGDIVLSETQPR